MTRSSSIAHYEEFCVWLRGRVARISGVQGRRGIGPHRLSRSPDVILGTTAAAVQSMGHEVRVVPATLVRSLGVGARRLKTDRRDAQVLSEVSRIDLPSVHLRSERSRDRKTLCGMRDALVQARTQLVNTVRGWLRTQLLKVRSGQVESFSDRVRGAALNRPDGMPAFVERQLQVIETLTPQINAANKELKEQAEQDEVCQLLMSIPGVGPITAVRFTATLDVPGRFPDAHREGAHPRWRTMCLTGGHFILVQSIFLGAAVNWESWMHERSRGGRQN